MATERTIEDNQREFVLFYIQGQALTFSTPPQMWKTTILIITPTIRELSEIDLNYPMLETN